MNTSFSPPANWLRIRSIDMHTEGEPLRVIVTGFPEAQGTTLLERRRFVRQHHDALRTALMWEPRGHADMYGALILPPEREDSHFGVLFLHNEGYSTMCGHAIIALAKLAIELGWVPWEEPETEVRIDTPAGQVRAWGEVKSNRVGELRFRNVPSFVAALDQQAEVQGLGRVRYDLAFGGAFYAYVDAASLSLELKKENTRKLIETGMAIKRAVAAQSAFIVHPFEEDLSFLYGTIFTDKAHNPAHHSRNVCVFAEGEVDRSPTGTGVSGRLALHWAKEQLRVGEEIVIESLIGSTFSGKVLEETRFGAFPAIIPEVKGRAFITGQHEFLIDPEDPWRTGFRVL